MAQTAEAPEGLTKKERKEFSREVARIRREAELRRRRRRRVLGWAGGLAGTLAGLALVALIVVTSVRAGLVGPLNMLSDGLLLNGDGSAITAVPTAALQPGAAPTPSSADYTKSLVLDLYVDYGSAKTSRFDAANQDAIESWVKAGYATLEIHPVALLNSTDGGYSARAANAVACVADAAPDEVLAVHDALVDARADAGESGLDDDELVALVSKAGVSDSTVDDCITGGRFDAWVHDATARAQEGTVTGAGMSSAFLAVADGQPYTGALDDADAFTAFLEQTASEAAAGADSGGTSGTDGTGTSGSGTSGTGGE